MNAPITAETGGTTATAPTTPTGDHPVTSAEYTRILDYYSNVSKPGSKAARLAVFLHDPAQARELVIQRAEEEAIAWVGKGRVLTAERFKLICRNTSLERIVAKLGVPASLWRAGNAYERRRAILDPEQRLTREQREQVWDDAVREHLQNQVAKGVTTLRWLPLHDGRSNRPGSTSIMACGGLAEWERLFDQPRTRRLGVTGDDGNPVEDADKALGVTDRTVFRPTAKWLAEHGIDRGMVDAMTDRELEEIGVDPASLRGALGGQPAANPNPRSREGVAHALYVVLRDDRLARRLAAGYTPLGAVSILRNLGLPARFAYTGVRFETMAEGARDETTRMAAWDEACARQTRHGARPGRDGYVEYLRAVADVLERLEAVA